MKKIIAFGASSSKKSINKKLADYAANQIKDSTVHLLDLNNFEMPIYSIDFENENGKENLAKKKVYQIILVKSLIFNLDGI
jgi:NAD(P)H-dependent FMN reductase